MKKELFIKSIEAIKKQFQLDEDVATHLGEAFPNSFKANLLPDNHFLLNALIDVLKKEMNDFDLNDVNSSWIEHFIYELEFGKKNYRLAITINDEEIKMSTSEELYDFLIKLK